MNKVNQRRALQAPKPTSQLSLGSERRTNAARPPSEAARPPFDPTSTYALRIADLERRIATLEGTFRVRLARADYDHLARILPLIYTRLSEESFTVASLRAAVIEIEDVSLAQALDAVGSTKTLGRLFARGVGHAVAGFRIVRDNEGSPVLWHVSNLGNIP